MSSYLAPRSFRSCFLSNPLFPAVALAGGALLTCSPRSRGPGQLECTLTYGGEEQLIRVSPVTDPYLVKPVNVRERFSFRAVFLHGPSAKYSIHLSTLERAEPKDILLHEAKYVLPLPGGTRSSALGFTGKQRVYSSGGREFEYFCALEAR